MVIECIVLVDEVLGVPSTKSQVWRRVALSSILNAKPVIMSFHDEPDLQLLLKHPQISARSNLS